jgi:uncharacterized protein with NRDE domain
MCILLAIRTPAEGGELWVAANRDEDLTRPWSAPAMLAADPSVFGGRDLVGGGSWLAVNLAAGFVVAVTNARLGARPGERSRGSLVVDVARERSLAEAGALLAELDLRRYGLFNLLVADTREGWLATNAPAPRIEAGGGPVVAVGNDPIDAPGERVIAAAERARFLAGRGEEDLSRSLQALLAEHGGGDPLCRHGERYGTVCSTILTLKGTAVTRYLFAPGPPCTTPFGELRLPTVER